MGGCHAEHREKNSSLEIRALMIFDDEAESGISSKIWDISKTEKNIFYEY